MYNRFQRFLLILAGIGICILVFAMPYWARTDSKNLAIESAARAVALEQPDDAAAHFALAKAEVALEKWHAAQIELDRALQLDPNHSFAEAAELSALREQLAPHLGTASGPASTWAFWSVSIILSLIVMWIAIRVGRRNERRRYLAYLSDQLPVLLEDIRGVRSRLHDTDALSHEERYERLDFLGQCHGQLTEALYSIRHGSPDWTIDRQMLEVSAFLAETVTRLEPAPEDDQEAPEDSAQSGSPNQS